MTVAKPRQLRCFYDVESRVIVPRRKLVAGFARPTFRRKLPDGRVLRFPYIWIPVHVPERMGVAESARSAVKTDLAGAASHVESASNITVGASDTFLYFAVEADTSTPGTISAKWDDGGTNQAMTLIGSITDSTSTPAMTLAVFGLVNPTAGAKKFSWVFSGQSTSVNSYHFAVSFTGTETSSVAAATEGYQTASAATGASATVTSSASIPTGDMAVAAYNNINGYSNAFTAGTNPGDGGTAVGKNESLTTNMAGEYYSGAGSTIAASATQGASGAYVAAIVGIKAPAAATGPVLTTPRRVFIRRHHQPFVVPRQFDRNKIVGWAPKLILPTRSLAVLKNAKLAA